MTDTTVAKPAGATPAASPDAIMQLGFGFWGSKTLLSAVELGLFTELAGTSARRWRRCEHGWACTRAVAHETSSMRWSPWACSSARTAATPTPPRPISSSTGPSPRYLGGILEMANARLFRFWADLTEGLRTGRPQNEAKTGGTSSTSCMPTRPALRAVRPRHDRRSAWASPIAIGRASSPGAATAPSPTSAAPRAACRCSWPAGTPT